LGLDGVWSMMRKTGSQEWLGIVACPDCRAPLVSSGDDVACSKCGREVGRVGDALDLLPGSFVADGDGGSRAPSWRSAFVRAVYARHNLSRAVTRPMARVLGALRGDSWGLNLGSGATSLGPRVLNLDVKARPNVQIVGAAENLPFGNETLRCVLCQEVLEHLRDPDSCMLEVARVLEPGGMLYVQAPFIIGYHSEPHDYWRFTAEGLREVVRRAGLEVLETGASVGAGTSMYRIAVEFWASLAAVSWDRLYMPAKGLAAVLLAPLRWADLVTAKAGRTNRIAAGFYAVSRKPAAGEDGEVRDGPGRAGAGS